MMHLAFDKKFWYGSPGEAIGPPWVFGPIASQGRSVRPSVKNVQGTLPPHDGIFWIGAYVPLCNLPRFIYLNLYVYV